MDFLSEKPLNTTWLPSTLLCCTRHQIGLLQSRKGRENNGYVESTFFNLMGFFKVQHANSDDTKETDSLVLVFFKTNCNVVNTCTN